MRPPPDNRTVLRHDRRHQRSLARTLVACLQIGGHVLAPWRRRWRQRWGARRGEPDPSLPGENLVPTPNWEFTHAVSIAAPPEHVWPWVAQIGQGRGGLYTFERLENVFGCRITNTDRILPEYQTITVGDQIRLAAGTPGLRVAAVEPGRSLVLRGWPVDLPDTEADNLWAFHVLGDGQGRSRLLSRGKSSHGGSLTDRLLFSPLLVEPIGFVMGREMLLGIKERAEHLAVAAS